MHDVLDINAVVVLVNNINSFRENEKIMNVKNA
jgi:hypothetical protein